MVVRITCENTAEGYKPTGFSFPEVLSTMRERGIHSGDILSKGGIDEDP